MICTVPGPSGPARTADSEKMRKRVGGMRFPVRRTPERERRGRRRSIA